jgi:hypothetical protein
VVVVAVFVIAIRAFVMSATGNGPGLQPAQGAPTAVRCDAPIRAVPGYLNWPCGSERATGYFQTGFRDMFVGFEKILNVAPAGPDGLQMRVLAYGKVPGVTGNPGFIAAEFWRARGGRARVAYSESQGPTGPYLVARLSSPNAVAYNLDLVFSNPGVSAATCFDISPAHQAAPPQCTDIFLVRPGITALRLVRPGLAEDTVAVRHGFAGLPATSNRPADHRNWQVEALDAQGNVVGTVGYASAG